MTTTPPRGIPFTMGDRMRKARTTARMRQDEVAERLDVSRGLIAQWEADEIDPRTGQLAAFADVVDIDPVWLVGWRP